MIKILIKFYRWFIPLIGMLIFGSITLILVWTSLGLLRNFFVQFFYKYASGFIMKINGYSFDLPTINDFPKHQVMYIINHNSYLDLFLLTAIGLKNTRFILSEVTMKYFPLVLSAKAIGTFYIPQKKHAKRRLRFFKRITAFLQKTNYSIITSAEGVHHYVHGILPFNKGIFHMAMEAKVPIVPMYIHVPEIINPYKGKYSKSGKIHLELFEEIDVSDWKLENIWDEIAEVRQLYVNRFNELNNSNIT